MISSPAPEHLLQASDEALTNLAEARAGQEKRSNKEVLAAGGALLAAEGGLQALYLRVPQIEAAGVFDGTDWGKPSILLPTLAMRSLRQGGHDTTVIEALSELRLLAVALGYYFHPGISAEQARNFVTQVMALNLDLLSGQLNEADRERADGLGPTVMSFYQYLVAHMGYESILPEPVTVALQ